MVIPLFCCHSPHACPESTTSYTASWITGVAVKFDSYGSALIMNYTEYRILVLSVMVDQLPGRARELCHLD